MRIYETMNSYSFESIKLIIDKRQDYDKDAKK